MNVTESFRATIFLGILYMLLVAAAAILWRRDMALLAIIVTAGLAYLTQCLNTTGAILSDPAFAAATAMSAQSFFRIAKVMWCLTICVGAAAGLMLMLAT